MRDDRIQRHKAPFCPVSERQEWIKSQQKTTVNRTGGGLKVCLACQTIILPSVEDEGESPKLYDDIDHPHSKYKDKFIHVS